MKQQNNYKLIAILLIATFLALYMTFVLSWTDARSSACTLLSYPTKSCGGGSEVYLPLVVNGEPGPTPRPTPTLAPTVRP